MTTAAQTAGGELLAAAVAYAERGWPVFPVDGKIPLTPRGFKDATADAGIVAAAFDIHRQAGVAVATGAASGLVVLDEDTGKGGGRTRVELEAKLGKLPQTFAVLTGGGGRHYYFNHPGRDVPCSAGKLGAGLDVRGDGGYVIAPPSPHESGRPYKVLTDLDVADLPAAWLEAIVESRQNGRAQPIGTVIPNGQRNTTMASLAGTMRRRGMGEAEILAALRVTNEERCEQRLPDDEIAAIVRSIGKKQPAEELGVRVYTGPTRALDDVVASFRKWLHLPDAGALYVTLAAVIANRLPGDPLWLLLVAASSSGKTEILISLDGLEEVVAAATMTEASLLSGTPKKDHAAGATGGLLLKVGDYGILTLKDFGSVLSMNREARAAVLAALRECYDGSWDRHVGVDGGRTLHWDGKLGLIAGVTTVVDSHHAVLDLLGSRFAFYRVEVDERDAQGMRALNHRAGARTMRTELRDAVTGFFAGIQLPEQDTLTEADKHRLVTLADLVTMARSPVERDRVSRDIEMIPDPEAPARFALMLASLLEGLRVIGLDAEQAWQLVTKTAYDSMPAQRRRVLELLADTKPKLTKPIALVLGLPTTTARRTLEDLAAHGIVTRESEGDGKADTWQLSAWTKDRSGQ